MSFIDKTKTLIKLTVKEGSINILILMVSCLLIFRYFPNTLISKILEIVWITGFVISMCIIIYRIALNQYVILRIRLDKLEKDLKENNYESLKADNKLFDMVAPLIATGIKSVFKKKGIEIPIDIKEIDIKEIYKELINENGS